MKFKIFAKSFYHAMHGLIYVFKNEQNFRLQIMAAIAVIATSIIFPISKYELIAVILLVLLVMVLELINSAFELFVDVAKPRLHHKIQLIKDIMAATVFLSSLVAIVVGVIIFWPHFFEFLGKI